MRPTFPALFSPLFLAAMSFAGTVCPVPGETARPPLERDLIHSSYLEGDFEQAIQSLEKAMSEQRACSHEDSVFAYKHLGVMNAAREETREKGKYYLLQLLKLEPTANILDMYASDLIYQLFNTVKGEFETNKSIEARATGPVVAANGAEPSIRTGLKVSPIQSDPASNTTTNSVTTQPASVVADKGKWPSRKTWIWAGSGGTVLLGAAFGFYFLLETHSSPTTTRFRVE